MNILNPILIIAAFIGSVVLAPSLPAEIPVHWNIRGQIDSYWPKNIAIWLIPSLTFIIWVLFQVLPHLDPKKDKYKLFKKEWQIIQTALIAFFTYLQFAIFYVAKNLTVSFLPFMFAGLGVLFILTGNYLSKIRQNYFIGMKLPWTLSSEENWNKTHRFGSWCFVVAGIVILIEAFTIRYAPVVILGSIILTAVLPGIYSYLLFAKKASLMKFVFLGLFTIIALLFIIRVLSGEDGWVCTGGKWVAHGHPDAPIPRTKCP
jgi:uncharacterized membrane protein